MLCRKTLNMFKLWIAIATALVIFVAPMQAQWSAEERLKNSITSLLTKLINAEVKMKPETTVTSSSFPLVSMLSILALHSSGRTQQELLDILNLESCNEIREIIPKYLSRFNTQGEVKSVLDFKAFGNIFDPFTDLFKQNLADLLNGETENINYNHPKTAARIINQWVKNHIFDTENYDVIRKNEIPDDSAMILVSTQSVEVKYDSPYNIRGTTEIEFHVNNNEVVIMPAIYGDGLMKFAAIDSLDCAVIEVPMKGNRSAIIFYPNQIEGLSDLVSKLQDADLLYKALEMLETTCITLYMPLGKSNAVVDFRKYLEHIIPSIFDPATAEFSGISQGPNPVYVSSMLHRIHATALNESRCKHTTINGDEIYMVFQN
nr:Spi7 [Andraca theae]